MEVLKKIILRVSIIVFLFNGNVLAKPIPNSFADLAEELMPSVVNISTTQTIKTQSNPFPVSYTHLTLPTICSV